MEPQAIIKFEANRKKFVAYVNGREIAKSNSSDYLKTRLIDGTYKKKVGALKISNVQIIKGDTVIIGTEKNLSKKNKIKNNLKEEEIGETSNLTVTKFDINQRFGFMNELITMVIKKKTNSAIICGPGGLGKTYEVFSALKTSGLKPTSWVNSSDEEDSDEDESSAASITKPGDYTVVKGFSTPKALYRTLYENRNKIIVFDDCDSVLRDPTGANLLKAALDSYDERWISWRTEGPSSDDLPEVFKFNGSVIFISNLPQWKMDQAIRTRAFVIDLEMTIDQRLDRMRNVLVDVMPEYDLSFKQEALSFMEKFKFIAREINFRTLINVIKIRMSDSKNWKELAEYSLTCM